MRSTDVQLRSLLHVLRDNARNASRQRAVCEKARGIWHELSWSQFYDLVAQCAAGLRSLGFGPGDCLLVIGDNNVRLYAGMLAAAMLRGHAVPAFPDARAEELVHIAPGLTLRAALVGDQEQADKVIELRELGRATGTIIYDEPRGMRSYDEPDLLELAVLLERGAAAIQADPGLPDALVEAVQAQDAAILVHSSGTTGQPKAIVLSHDNLLWVSRSCVEADVIVPGSELVAYLPMAWIGDFAISVAAMLVGRCILNVPESQDTVMRDLREVAPTFYVATPRSWENLLTSIEVAMEGATPLKRWVYRRFVDGAVAQERRRLTGSEPGLGERVWRQLGEWLVYGPIKDKLGLSRVSHALTGGEAIGEDTLLYYRALGVRLRQLYGQSEGSAFATIQAAGDVRLNSVGCCLPGAEIRIQDGEILVRSPGVFSGYLNRPDATAEALQDGWLRTGDAGYLEDGQLVVLGRFSEMVRTASGESYVPTYVENRLKFSPYVKDAAVFGAGRDYLAALVCIDFGAVGHWAQVNGVPYVSYADLSQNPRVQELVRAAVARVNKSLKPTLQIRRFACLHKEFDPDDGEITRTRKLRRNVVETAYASVIEALYGGGSHVVMQARVQYESGDTGLIERRLILNEV